MYNVVDSIPLHIWLQSDGKFSVEKVLGWNLVAGSDLCNKHKDINVITISCFAVQWRICKGN